MKKFPREMRKCKCKKSFEVIVTSPKRFCSLSCATKGRVYSEERNKKISLKNKGRKRSEESKQKNRDARLGKKRDKESIQKGIETRRKNAEIRGYYHSEETKRKIGEKNSISLKGRLIPQEVIDKMKKTRQEKGPYSLSASHKQAISTFQKTRKHKPTSDETKEKLRKIMLGKKPSIETRKKISESVKLYWKNLSKKEAEARISKALRASRKKTSIKPNKFELSCMEKLNNLYPDKFIYVGDGTCIINRHSPDALSEEFKIVVLFNGVFWHLKKKKYDVTDYNKRKVEKLEAEPFLKAGYKVIFIWENELSKMVIYNYNVESGLMSKKMLDGNFLKNKKN